MIKRHIAAGLLAALSLAPACSSAGETISQFLNGNDLWIAMRGDTHDRRVALYFVAGVHDSMDGVVFCSPRDVVLGQVRDVIQKELDSAPEMRHLAASKLIAFSLSRIWPCRTSSNRQQGSGL